MAWPKPAPIEDSPSDAPIGAGPLQNLVQRILARESESSKAAKLDNAAAVAAQAQGTVEAVIAKATAPPKEVRQQVPAARQTPTVQNPQPATAQAATPKSRPVRRKKRAIPNAERRHAILQALHRTMTKDIRPEINAVMTRDIGSDIKKVMTRDIGSDIKTVMTRDLTPDLKKALQGFTPDLSLRLIKDDQPAKKEQEEDELLKSFFASNPEFAEARAADEAQATRAATEH